MTGHNYVHKLIAPTDICHFGINQTQPPATTSSARLRCIVLYKLYIVICSFLGNSPASESELPKKEHITIETRRKLENKTVYY